MTWTINHTFINSSIKAKIFEKICLPRKSLSAAPICEPLIHIIPFLGMCKQPKKKYNASQLFSVVVCKKNRLMRRSWPILKCLHRRSLWGRPFSLSRGALCIVTHPAHYCQLIIFKNIFLMGWVWVDANDLCNRLSNPFFFLSSL